VKKDSLLIVIILAISALLGIPVGAVTLFDFYVNPPVPVIIPIGPLIINNEISFDGSKSYDPDGTMIILHKWNFGDKQEAKGELVTHSYKKPQVYTITLTVMDLQKQSALTQKDIDVKNNENETKQIRINVDYPIIHKMSLESDKMFSIQSTSQDPVSIINIEGKFEPNKVILFSAKGSFDPEGNEITYIWKTDDVTISSEKEFYYSFDREGKYHFVLQVTDSFGLKDEQQVELEIEKSNPFNAIFTIEFLIFQTLVLVEILVFSRYIILRKRKKHFEKINRLKMLFHKLSLDAEFLKSKKIPNPEHWGDLESKALYGYLQPEIKSNFFFYLNELKLIQSSLNLEDLEQLLIINRQLKKLIKSNSY